MENHPTQKLGAAPPPGPRPAVVPAGGDPVPLGAGELVVGSSPDADLVLDDPAVSRRHVALSVRSAGIRVRDLGSTNGTFVGPYRVTESLVPLGTVLRVGGTTLALTGGSARPLVPSSADRFGELRGGSVAMRQLYAVLERAGDATVLLDGETGTGKELCARALHAASGRSGPLVVLDGSAVAPELVQSQLFGHVRGAFTGAGSDHRGVFEEASGGTLFIDEFDALGPAVQPRLLRVLESREVIRLGEHAPRPVDVRVIAACGRSPEALVASGSLRQDLYFRLAVVRVTMPTLRDRLEDLPVLCRHLLHALAAPEVEVRPGPALTRLSAHPWPGNVRELRNVLQRALALAPSGAGSLDDLPIQLTPVGVSAPTGGSLFAELPFHEAKERVVAAWEARYLAAVFARNGENLSATARDVGLSRLHLRRLLRRHGLVP